MKVLLDECVDQRLAREITGHEVVTVPDAGWASAKDGHLLSVAQKNFDAFVTVDRNLAFQQHVPRFSIAVLIPTAPKGEITWVEI